MENSVTTLSDSALMAVYEIYIQFEYPNAVKPEDGGALLGKISNGLLEEIARRWYNEKKFEPVTDPCLF